MCGDPPDAVAAVFPVQTHDGPDGVVEEAAGQIGNRIGDVAQTADRSLPGTGCQQGRAEADGVEHVVAGLDAGISGHLLGNHAAQRVTRDDQIGVFGDVGLDDVDGVGVVDVVEIKAGEQIGQYAGGLVEDQLGAGEGDKVDGLGAEAGLQRTLGDADGALAALVVAVAHVGIDFGRVGIGDCVGCGRNAAADQHGNEQQNGKQGAENADGLFHGLRLLLKSVNPGNETKWVFRKLTKNILSYFCGFVNYLQSLLCKNFTDPPGPQNILKY